jgi:hypothetical protein
MADFSGDPHILGPGLLPTPFTADEIRAGCPDGRFIRLLVEVDVQEPFIRTNRFVGRFRPIRFLRATSVPNPSLWRPRSSDWTSARTSWNGSAVIGDPPRLA